MEREWGLKPGEKKNLWTLTLNNPQYNMPGAREEWEETHPGVQSALPEKSPYSYDTDKINPRLKRVPYGLKPRHIVGEEEARFYVEWAIDHFLNAPRSRNRGCGVCAEVGENGVFHLHLALCFANKNGGTARTVVSLFPNADIEVAKGNVAQVTAYLEKSGRWAKTSKAETTIIPPVFSGEELRANPGAKMANSSDHTALTPTDEKRRQLFDAIWKDDKSKQDILADPMLSVYASGCTRWVEDLLEARDARRAHSRTVRITILYDGAKSNDPTADMCIAEQAARIYLDDRYPGHWATWHAALPLQPEVDEDTRALLLVVPSWLPEMRALTFRLISGAPMRVPRARGTSPWGAWTEVVIVANREQSTLLSDKSDKKIEVFTGMTVDDILDKMGNLFDAMCEMSDEGDDAF